MTRGIVGVFVASCAAIAAAYGAALAGDPGAWAPWALVLGSAGTLTATIALGARQGGRLPRGVAPVLWLTALLVVGGFGFALARPAAEGALGALWLGLPVRTAVVFVAVGFLPMVLLPVAYALTFDPSRVDEAMVRRIRDARPREDA